MKFCTFLNNDISRYVYWVCIQDVCVSGTAVCMHALCVSRMRVCAHMREYSSPDRSQIQLKNARSRAGEPGTCQCQKTKRHPKTNEGKRTLGPASRAPPTDKLRDFGMANHHDCDGLHHIKNTSYTKRGSRGHSSVSDIVQAHTSKSPLCWGQQSSHEGPSGPHYDRVLEGWRLGHSVLGVRASLQRQGKWVIFPGRMRKLSKCVTHRELWRHEASWPAGMRTQLDCVLRAEMPCLELIVSEW
jgi:hypothetical protein